MLPLAENIKPLKSGQEGGLFKPVKHVDFTKIDSAALEVLETIGIEKAIPSIIGVFPSIGFKLSKEERILFTGKVLKESLKKACYYLTFLYQSSIS